MCLLRIAVVKTVMVCSKRCFVCPSMNLECVLQGSPKRGVEFYLSCDIADFRCQRFKPPFFFIHSLIPPPLFGSRPWASQGKELARERGNRKDSQGPEYQSTLRRRESDSIRV